MPGLQRHWKGDRENRRRLTCLRGSQYANGTLSSLHLHNLVSTLAWLYAAVGLKAGRAFSRIAPVKRGRLG